MGSPQDATHAELQSLVQELADAAHSFDATVAVSDYHARSAVLAKARQITSLMLDPADMAGYYSGNMVEIVALRTLMKCRVFENIPASGSISLHDLSAATGAQESMLERLLRILVGTGFVHQADDGSYANTKFSKDWMTGSGLYFQLMNDEFLTPMVRFHDYLAEKGALKEPDSNTHNPYTWYYNREGEGTWQVMASYPERMAVFQAGLQIQDRAVPVVGFYDFGKLQTSDPSRMELVDVGGGHGQAIKEILDYHKELSPEKMVLQDQPSVIEMAKSSDLLPKDVVKMEHDFWTEQPIKGAKAYYIRRVLHDYSAPDCVRLLKQIAESMSEDSVVLVADMVVTNKVTPENFPAAVMDAIMFINGGKEKTETLWKKIFLDSGLEMVKIHLAPVGTAALIEAHLVAKS